jgi:hypothetical protein
MSEIIIFIVSLILIKKLLRKSNTISVIISVILLMIFSGNSDILSNIDPKVVHMYKELPTNRFYSMSPTSVILK